MHMKLGMVGSIRLQYAWLLIDPAHNLARNEFAGCITLGDRSESPVTWEREGNLPDPADPSVENRFPTNGQADCLYEQHASLGA